MIEQSKNMHVSFCADVPYVPILCVALTSLYMHNYKRAVDVTVVLQYVDQESRDLITETAQRFNRTVEIIDLNNIDLSHLPEYSQPVSTYYRLLLPSLLKDRARTIYLDSDLVVETDLSELFDANLQGQPLGGVPDRPEIQAGLQAHVNRPGDLYINAGVLVMDLKIWREQKIADQCMQWLTENPTVATMMDQDAINYILFKRKVFFDRRFNLNPIHDPPAVTLAKIPKRVLHFAGAIKPWHSWYDFDLIEIFNFYKKVAKAENKIPFAVAEKFGQFISVANQHYFRENFKESAENYYSAILNLAGRFSLSSEIVERVNQAAEMFARSEYEYATTVLRSVLAGAGILVDTRDIYQIPEIR
jgi:lipopolysaccharide biosynthesis glycosyltransferase